MGTRVTLMADIAYTASYMSKNPKPIPKLLEDEDAWNRLVEDVGCYIQSCKNKNKGKGAVKPFTVTLVDTSGGGDSKDMPATTGKKGKKSKCSEGAGQPQGVPALKEHELFQQLEQKHFCQECKKPCVILDSGDHHILTHTELATWALLLVSSLAAIPRIILFGNPASLATPWQPQRFWGGCQIESGRLNSDKIANQIR
ncbi:hypothetical protein B0H12DRAFT_48132 [Mycena haematopus]|nr:hypothetical protein B0H12DRAFT_48132 [Mycena haematopus]